MAALVGTFAVAPAVEADGFDCPSYHTTYDSIAYEMASTGQSVHVRHRGSFNTEIPENSLQAFRTTMANCEPALETDVRATKDGKLVLFHDARIGRMLEPTYNPIANTGPNGFLDQMTFEELRQDRLLNRKGEVTEQRVPTPEELLQTVVNERSGVITFFDIKSADLIIPLATLINDYANKYPDEYIDDRFVLKVNAAEYPTLQSWMSALEKAGINNKINIMPVYTPATADRINQGPEIPQPSGMQLSTNAARSVANWAVAPATFAPAVELVVKDSSDFVDTRPMAGRFGDYRIPASFEMSNTRDGTMAQFVAILKNFNKPSSLFVPVPDYMMWKPGPVAGYTVPNILGDHVPLNVQEGFFNNDSACCYSLKDRLSPSPIAREEHDWRMNLDWVIGMGFRLITSDDTISTAQYFKEKNLLDLAAEPKIPAASESMNSMLYYAVGGYAPPYYTDVQFKGWDGGSSGLWQGQVCIWSNNLGYAWATNCAKYHASGKTNMIRMQVSSQPGKMLLQDLLDFQCLKPKGDDVIWSDDCSSPDAQWTRTPENRYLDGQGRCLTFSWQNRYTEGLPYAYLYMDTACNDSWSQWNFER